MSGVEIAVKSLLAASGVTAKVGQRIGIGNPPMGWALPLIIVRRVSEDDEKLLGGHPTWPVTRVSLEILTAGDEVALEEIGEAVDAALKPLHNYAVAGYVATFTKEGTDETGDSSEEIAPSGYATASRRIIDYYIRWRTST